MPVDRFGIDEDSKPVEGSMAAKISEGYNKATQGQIEIEFPKKGGKAEANQGEPADNYAPVDDENGGY